VFEDEDFEKTLDLIDNTTEYALTGAMSVSRLPSFPVYHSFLNFLIIYLLPSTSTVFPQTAKRSSQQPTACATPPETCTTTRNARALLLDSSRLVVHAAVGRMIKRGV
jgi:hypothetical protein